MDADIETRSDALSAALETLIGDPYDGFTIRFDAHDNHGLTEEDDEYPGGPWCLTVDVDSSDTERGLIPFTASTLDRLFDLAFAELQRKHRIEVLFTNGPDDEVLFIVAQQRH